MKDTIKKAAKELLEGNEYRHARFIGDDAERAKSIIHVSGLLDNPDTPGDVRAELQKLNALLPVFSTLDEITHALKAACLGNFSWAPDLRCHHGHGDAPQIQNLTLSPSFNIHHDLSSLSQSVASLGNTLRDTPINYTVIVAWIRDRLIQEEISLDKD